MDGREAREALTVRRRGLVSELDALTEIPRDPMTPVSFGKRIGDGTTEAVERLARVGQAKELHAMLVDVERALAKLDEGTYGFCDRCGAMIPDERLEARPWSVLCVSDSAAR